MPHAAAGMRMDPPVSVPIDASDMPVATAIADPPLDPPGDRDGSLRVARGTKRGFLAGRAERELVQVALADENRAGTTQSRRDRGIRRGRRGRRHPRPGRRRHAALVDEILERDGNAVQRPEPLTASPRVIGSGGRGHRLAAGHRDERAVGVVLSFDARETRGGQIQRRQRALSLRGQSRADVEISGIHQGQTRDSSAGGAARSFQGADRSTCIMRDRVSSTGHGAGQPTGLAHRRARLPATPMES